MKRTIIALLVVAALLVAGCASAIAEQPPYAKYESAFWQVRDIGEPVGAVRVSQEMEEKAAVEEAADPVEEESSEDWYEECNEPVYGGGCDYGNPFMQDGVAHDENYSYTWYSQNALPGGGLTELNDNGRHIDESTGFVVDGDGYIAVAMNGVEQGTVIDTIWGEAKVYDVKQDGAPYDGQVDVYTDFPAA